MGHATGSVDREIKILYSFQTGRIINFFLQMSGTICLKYWIIPYHFLNVRNSGTTYFETYKLFSIKMLEKNNKLVKK